MAVTQKICPACGTQFGCANLGDGTTCWCAALPPIMPITDKAGCLCPQCLKKEIVRHTEQYASDVAAGRCDNHIGGKLPMDAPPIDGIDYYMEDGRFVLKAWYLLKRGYCCGNGCRHCPYKPQTTS